MVRIVMFALAASALGACGTGGNPNRNDVQLLPLETTSAGADATGRYRIGATDLINVTVFQVPTLSLEEVRVDAAGNLQMPLIGALRAAGRTPDELAREIEVALGRQYLRDPQVSVTVAEAASQKVTVDGAVAKPGVYLMRGRTTLLQAIAMAEGPTRVADLSEVAIFRDGEKGRMVARFDVAQIRSGRSPDPDLEGNDVIIVDTSRLNSTVRDLLQALPGLAVFGYL